MIYQLNPTLPVETPKGSGVAHFIFEHGDEHHIQFHVAIDSTGEFWTFNNPDVRIAYNITMGRPKPTQPYIWGKQWQQKDAPERLFTEDERKVLLDIKSEFKELADSPENGNPIYCSRMHFREWAELIDKIVRKQ